MSKDLGIGAINGYGSKPKQRWTSQFWPTSGKSINRSVRISHLHFDPMFQLYTCYFSNWLVINILNLSIHSQIYVWWPICELRNWCAAAHRKRWTIWEAALWSACRVLHLARCQWEWYPGDLQEEEMHRIELGIHRSISKYTEKNNLSMYPCIYLYIYKTTWKRWLL